MEYSTPLIIYWWSVVCLALFVRLNAFEIDMPLNTFETSEEFTNASRVPSPAMAATTGLVVGLLLEAGLHVLVD